MDTIKEETFKKINVEVWIDKAKINRNRNAKRNTVR